MPELKPCPFCGSEVEVKKIPLWYGNGRGYSGCYEFKIKCESCGCTVNQPNNDSVYRSEEKARENAIEAWNRRADNAPTIDPECKKGEWIDLDGHVVKMKDGCPVASCWCSECENWLVGSDEYAVKGLWCPSCGADMREDIRKGA